MEKIKLNKNIAFCINIVYILALIILQNKEFSSTILRKIDTNLIPKGFNNELAFSTLNLPLSQDNNSVSSANEKEGILFFSKDEKTSSNLVEGGTSKLKPLLFEYLVQQKTVLKRIGEGDLDLKNKKILNYNFLPVQGNYNSQISRFLSEDLIKLLNAFFKSIYCIISKPKFINTPDKLIIEILYYITIPNNNIFKWYNFIFKTKRLIAYNYINAVQESENEDDNFKLNLKKLSQKIKNLKRKRLRVRKWNKFIKIILKKNSIIRQMLFNLNKTNITSLYYNKFTILFKLLSSYFKKPIELNLIRLHKADYDSNILAKLFFLILKRKNIKSAIRKIYFKNKIGILINDKDVNLIGAKKKKLAKFIPAYISGLYVHIGGRLLREKIVPKKTTKKFEKGAIATGKVNFLDTARISKKNKKGAFTIKIAFAQNLRLEN